MRVGPFVIERTKEPEPNGNGNGHVELTERKDFREIGASGNSNYTGILLHDYNAKLRGPLAIKIYDQMRKGDGKVKAVLTVVKAPLLAAQWYMEPASNDPVDIEVAQFVDFALNNMSHTWIDVLRESLLCMDYGYYLFEKVFKWDEWNGKKVVTWKKMGPRHPNSIVEWDFDANGGVKGVWHSLNATGSKDVYLPVDKLLRFSFEEEAGNPEGVSILRPAYKHWYYKDNLYKVDAIQKERHGIGIPEVELPPNFTENDKRLAGELAENLRTNEKAHIVRPQGFNIGFVELKGQPVDVLESAQHHDLMIASTVLAQFLNLGATDTGSRAVSDSQQDIFTKSLRHVADFIRGNWNQYAIPQLVDYNYKVKRYPKLRVRRIGEGADWRALSVTIRNLVESAVITPDPRLEVWLRDYMDFPAATPQAEDRDSEDRVASMGRVPKPTE